MDRDAWCAAIHEVAELDMTEWMNWTELKYVKEILRDLKWETDKSAIMVRGFHILQSVMDRQDRQKISEYKEDLNSTINKLDIIDINEYFIPKQQNTH